ncbi:MAG: LysE family translocator [Muribaculaceae bacterium]|nr:LysE family translocator [Muribaculaceae bacterium]
MSFLESIIYMAWRGVAIGLIISAPMGPVGMLCIQRTLDKGRRAGLFTGIGAAISDLFYSLLTGFGLSFIEEFLERNSNIIQLVGSAVLIAFAVFIFRKNPTASLRKPIAEEVSVKKNIIGGFLFTFSNPLILFLIIGLFARFNFIKPEFSSQPGFAKVIFMTVGYAALFFGALLWWWFITFVIDKVRGHFNIRSMWWINKIIGVIILIFAIVGIFSATSAMMKADDSIRCWNAGRGYGPFAEGEDRMVSAREGADAPGAEFLEFRCKVKCRRPSTPWGFRLVGTDGSEASITLTASETPGDGISSAAALDVRAISPCDTAPALLSERSNIVGRLKDGLQGVDPSGATNFYKLVVYRDLLTLFGGLHTPKRLLQLELPDGFRADSVGFFLPREAQVELDELRLSTGNFGPAMTMWTDRMLLEEYLDNSRDPMEGYVAILDRNMEENLLRMGGDYRMAIVRETDGYDLVYLSGAKVNAERWQPGARKAHLSPSGVSGVWNVEWIDAMGATLSHELKAQSDLNGTLTIQFPYQNSQLRLQRLTE